MLGLAGRASAVPIDLTGSTPSISGPTSLHIDDIAIVGSSYWADFDWNENFNVFVVSGYGEMTPATPNPLGWLSVARGAGGGAAGVPIDLTGATPTVTGPTTLYIDGIAALGSTYWADFQWNDSNNVFQVSAYGEESSGAGGFVLVPAGTFTMGSPASELGRSGDEVEHQVTLTRDFYLSVTEVTQAEWVAVMGSNPSGFGGCDDCPVERVSWNDAVDYCNARSVLESLVPAYEVSGSSVTWDPTADGYRLPTESEWEYACRSGSTTAFYNGPIIDSGCGDVNLDAIGWYCGNNAPWGTKAVGQKAPNAWGLYDMSGGVQEWCWDWHGSYPSGPVSDPSGPASGWDRVLRGGYWNGRALTCRSARRAQIAPTSFGDRFGFRLARRAPLDNEPPVAEILWPLDGAAFTQADSMGLSGSGTDPEDGPLAGDALVWTSNLDGELGTGEELEVVAGRLRVGRHEISLTVTDGDSLSASTSIAIIIAPAPGQLVRITAGTFSMGSPPSELGRGADEAEHGVTLVRDFYLAATELTQAEWVVVMGSNPSYFSGCEACPVEQVSWYDAVDYCNARSLLEGLDPAYEVNGTSVRWNRIADGYRLPTEAEWEYACRAGSTTAFYNGPITELVCNDPNLHQIGWYCGNDDPWGTKVVGQKVPNAWGLYDMSGNVWEWGWDWYESDYPSGPSIDPVGPDSGSWRTSRGGDWKNIAEDCRSAKRRAFTPNYARDRQGFRPARSLRMLTGPPVVELLLPLDGASYPENHVVPLSGTGEDMEDGPLLADDLAWSSDLDGHLGKGEDLILAAGTLRMGTHVLTLSGTDDDHNTGTDAITITIEAPWSNNVAPTAEILSPAAGDIFTIHDPIELSGRGMDPEDGRLTGDALVWQDAMDGQLGTGEELVLAPGSLSLGLHSLTLFVTDDDFGVGAEVVDFIIEDAPPVNEPPVAVILFPLDGDIFTEDDLLHFSGRGTDPEEGVLSGDALVWTSDLDGELGTGEELSLGAAGLQLGTHVLTLTATDSDTLFGTDSIAISIVESSAPDGFVLIPAGTFTMGSPESELGRELSEAQHEVTLTRDFYLAKTEVTQAEWVAVMGSNPSEYQPPLYPQCDECPVETVGWYDVVDYCNALSILDGLEPVYEVLADTVVTWDESADGYRLPTESEWEYACRVGSTTAFYNGPITDLQCDDPNLDQIGWYCGNRGGGVEGVTHEVGQKLPNPWGLYDMSGNVWEWCWDWYHWDYPGGPVTDPVGPSVGERRVARGGSFSYRAPRCRSSSRDHHLPGGGGGSIIGFRIGRNVQTAEPPVAEILLPLDGDAFADDQIFDLTGRGTDLEDGDLTGASLVWRSNRDGDLGTGEALVLDAATLQLGRHILTLTATDSDSLSDADSVEMTIVTVPAGFSLIPAGTFTMGSPQSEEGHQMDEDLHEVTLTGALFLAETEVTQGEWASVMGSNPSYFQPPDHSPCDDCPVEQVDWYDAVDYCNALSALEGLSPAYDVVGDSVSWDPTASGYRLPTESEWEYACRAGTTTAFYNGDISNQYCNDPNLDQIGWYCGNRGNLGDPDGRPAAVAQKLPNAWGLYDTSGNVWEWCWDWYGDYPAGPVTDPVGWASGLDRTYRGGGWTSAETACRSAERGRFWPGYSGNTHGFRVARTLPIGGVPVAEILSPVDGDIFSACAWIDLEGRGSDPEDGELSGDALVWTSDLDGELGTGETLQLDASTLQWGDHVLTLAATDSDSNAGIASIVITIESTPEGFVLIPAGTFTMGSPLDELGRYVDENEHEVTLSRCFYLAETEVTQGEWVAVMGSNPSYFQPPDYSPCDDCPVEKVSWYDAVDYCNALSTLEGLSLAYEVVGDSVSWDPAASGYRLPTESEWEYACRAGSTTALYNGGITQTDCYPDSGLDQIGWYCGNTGQNEGDLFYGTKEVGLKIPNAWGLYDMSGNVGEWCWDWYERDYPAGPVIDPVGPDSGMWRIRRGGSWRRTAKYCRSAARTNSHPVGFDFYYGLRPARSTP